MIIRKHEVPDELLSGLLANYTKRGVRSRIVATDRANAKPRASRCGAMRAVQAPASTAISILPSILMCTSRLWGGWCGERRGAGRRDAMFLDLTLGVDRGVRADGTVDVLEVPSPSDDRDELRRRGQRGMANLGSGSKPGKITVRPKCKKKSAC